MKHVRTVACCALLLCVLAVGIAAIIGKGHDFTGRCTLCHTASEIESGGPSLLKRASLVARECKKCHTDRPDTSHPIGIRVTKKLPSGFPLDETGRMTCMTCHRSHPHEDAARRGKHLLRGGMEPQMLCYQCHRATKGRDKTEQHALAFNEAHAKTEPAAVSIGGLNQRSAACLSCHDGLGAKGKRGATSRKKGTGPPGSHPIGMRYPAGRGPRGDYHPKGSLSNYLKTPCQR